MTLKLCIGVRVLASCLGMQSGSTDMEARFMLSDQVYAKAAIAPTKNVGIWLGVSFMLLVQS